MSNASVSKKKFIETKLNDGSVKLIMAYQFYTVYF